jgi:hypothetical protein
MTHFAAVGLLVSLAGARDVRLSATAETVHGVLLGSIVLKDLPKAAPQAKQMMGEVLDQDAGLVDQAKGNDLRGVIQSPMAQISAPTQRSASLLQSFLPPKTIDEASCGNHLAPDGAVATSPDYLVEVENACIKVLNPNTGAVFSGPIPLGTFFGSSSNMGDPRALYDPVNARFLVSAEDFTANKVFIAASQSSNPTLRWNIYAFPMGLSCNGIGDFPMLGQTYQEPGDPMGAIYLSWNSFCKPGGYTSFVGAISKSQAYAGLPINNISGFSNLSFQGIWVDSVQPANVMNPLDHPRGEFLVNSFNYHFGGKQCSSGCNGVVVWFIYNAIPASGNSPSITGIVVPTANTYYTPTIAPEPGCAINTCGPSAGPPIISGEVTYSSGSLFGAISDAKGILVFELEPFVSDSAVITGAAMRNEICFACQGFSNGGTAYFGAIQPDSERNWMLVYNYSAPGAAECAPDPFTCIYPSAMVLTHRVTQARNTLHDNGTMVELGQAFFHQVNPNGYNRFGDYNGVAPNYSTPNSYWFGAEYVESNANWGKVVGAAAYTSPVQP